MTPAQQVKWTLIAALLMWAPAGLSTLTGHIDFARSGLLFVAAIFVGYVGTSILSYLLNDYRRTQHMVMRAQRQIEEIERRHDADPTNHHGRRKDD